MSSTRLRWLAPLLFVAIMFGGIGISQATGQWVTSGRQAIATGQKLTVDDLKGWMTLQEAADGLGIPLADLILAIGPPPGVELKGDTAFKDIEALVPGFELSTLRETLRAKITGAAVSGTTAPTSAAGATPSVPGPKTSHTPTGTPSGTGGGTGTGDGQAITGQMTLQQIAEANGLTPAAILAQAKLPADTPHDKPLRELTQSIPGFEVQAIRDAVAALK